MISERNIDRALQRALELGEVGVQVAAFQGEQLIVDTWAGHTSEERRQPVEASTLFPIFSVSKAIVATSVHLQAERGLIDYDAPLARYWPEYGTLGKEAVTVRHVLMHRAGVPQMPEGSNPQTAADWDWMVRGLEKQQPVYPPGSRNTYLSTVFGWLLGEIVRRTDPKRRSYPEFVREEIREPLGMDAYWIGIPEHERARVAILSYPGQPPAPPEGSLVRRAVPAALATVASVFNRADVQRACLPAVGGISNARSIARFFSLFANLGQLGGRRYLSEERILGMLPPRPDMDGPDETYGRPMAVGAGGFWLSVPGLKAFEADGRRILCHIGAGGSFGWADLDSGLSVAVCHNRMFAAYAEHPFATLGEAILELAARKRRG